MVTPFPSSAWNINVIGSGVAGGALTYEQLGTMPPQTGMVVLKEGYPISPPWKIQSIDPNTGLLVVGPSGASGQQLWIRNYPNEVYVGVYEAAKWAWPTGAGCVVLKNQYLTPPSGAVRGTDLSPGGGFYYG